MIHYIPLAFTLLIVLIVLLKILHVLIRISKHLNILHMDLKKLTDAATANTNAVNSATTLFQELAQEIKDANSSGDQAAVDAIADQISQSAGALSDAIVANTPHSADPGTPVTE